MYISPEQLELRLAGQNQLELKRRDGVGKHKSNIPHETKVLIGVLAKSDSQKNVADAFNTSPSNVSRIVNDQGLHKEIESASLSVKERVSSKAVDVLMKSLGVVDNKVGAVRTAGEASAIAKNIAGIVQQFIPRSPTEANSPKILINIHGSKQKSEEDFDAIEVESIVQ